MNNKPKKTILDSSSLIALFAKEKGWEKARQYVLTESIMSSVNVAEVYKYLIENQHLTKLEAKKLIQSSSVEIYTFTEEQALISAELYKDVKKYGLSLGDRACLALSIVTGFPVITCDSIWSKISLDIEIICIR